MIKLIFFFKSSPDLLGAKRGFGGNFSFFAPTPPPHPTPLKLHMLVQNFRISHLIGILFVLLVYELILLARIEVFTPQPTLPSFGQFLFF